MRAGQIMASYTLQSAGSLERVDFDAEALSSSPGRLMDEAQALSMFSSSRMILISGAGKLAKTVWANALESKTLETPVLFLADELAKNSAIRVAFEQAEHAAAIACYPASRGDVQALIDDRVRAAGLTITAAASAALGDVVGSDLALADRELEKLILYCHGRVAIEVDDVGTMLIDSSELGPAEAIDRAFEGNLEQVEATTKRCFGDGIAPSGLIAIALNHALMLRRLAAAENNGDAAFRAERIFFKRQDRVRAQQRLWPLDQLSRAIDTLVQAQLQMRKTPAVEETITIRALWSIALASRRR